MSIKQGQKGIFSFFAKRTGKNAIGKDGKKLSDFQRGYAMGRVGEMKKQTAMHTYKNNKSKVDVIKKDFPDIDSFFKPQKSNKKYKNDFPFERFDGAGNDLYKVSWKTNDFKNVKTGYSYKKK